MTHRIGTRANPLRQSTVKSDGVCEQQGEFVVDGAPAERVGVKAVLGTIVHAAYEHLHRNRDTLQLDRWVDEVLAEAHVKTVEAERPHGLTIQDELAIIEGLPVLEEQILNYVDRGYFDLHHTGLIGVEIPWRCKVGRWWCRGTMDLLHEPRPGVLHLVDFKSGIRSSERSRGLDLQMPLYGIGVESGELLLDGVWRRLRRLPAHFWLFETKALNAYKVNSKYGRKGDLKGNPSRQVYVNRARLNETIAQVDEMGARLNRLYNRGGIRMQVMKNGLHYGACHTCAHTRKCLSDTVHDFKTDSELATEFDQMFIEQEDLV